MATDPQAAFNWGTILELLPVLLPILLECFEAMDDNQRGVFKRFFGTKAGAKAAANFAVAAAAGKVDEAKLEEARKSLASA